MKKYLLSIVLLFLALPTHSIEMDTYYLTPVRHYDFMDVPPSKSTLQVNWDRRIAYYNNDPLHLAGGITFDGLGKCNIRTEVNSNWAIKEFDCDASEWPSLYQKIEVHQINQNIVFLSIHNKRNGNLRFHTDYIGERVKE